MTQQIDNNTLISLLRTKSFRKQIYIFSDAFIVLCMASLDIFLSCSGAQFGEKCLVGKSIIRVVWLNEIENNNNRSTRSIQKSAFVQIFIQKRYTKVIFTHFFISSPKLIQPIDFWLKFNAFFNNFA